MPTGKELPEPAPSTNDSTEIPPIISVDDHIVEPAHLWQTWLPAKYRDRGPRVERRRLGEMKWVGGAKMYEYELDVPDAPWCDIWFYEDLVHPNKRHVAAVGFDRDEMTMSPITYDEMRPGCYDPKARVQDMLANHVEASLSFPTMPRFCGQTFYEASDHDLGLACVKAYNDYMAKYALAIAAAARDGGNVKKEVKKMFKSCKSCHKKYRIPDED